MLFHATTVAKKKTPALGERALKLYDGEQKTVWVALQNEMGTEASRLGSNGD